MVAAVIRWCLDNRFLVLLAAAAAAAGGYYCLTNTPVDAVPDIGEKQVIVFADWPGRSPQDVDSQVTYPLTASLTGTPGVKTIRSMSGFGFSMVFIIFEDSVDYYWGRSRVLERLNVAFRAEFGHDLDLDLTYRDYATQVAMREALGSIAARPGTSKHGTGYALDVPELPCEYGYGTPQHTWLVGQGPSYGWVQPSWARQGGSNPEYWHFEYVG